MTDLKPERRASFVYDATRLAALHGSWLQAYFYPDLTEERLREIERLVESEETRCGGHYTPPWVRACQDLLGAYRSKVEELSKERTVCICGCPDADHESYEEGESCSNDEHECLRVCLAVRDMYVAKVEECERLRAELDEAKADSERLDWLIRTGRCVSARHPWGSYVVRNAREDPSYIGPDRRTPRSAIDAALKDSPDAD